MQMRKSASHGEAGYQRKERDFYPTEPWVTRALLKAVDFRLDPTQPKQDGLNGPVIWEPACGDGRMASVLDAEYHVYSTDIADYGFGYPGFDFLDPSTRVPADLAAIVTNPPFDLAVKFIVRALELTKPQLGKVAILQRHEFDAPQSNHILFRRPFPFAAKLVLHKRPRWSDEDKASPRFPYAWYLWDWRHEGPPILRYLPDPDKAAPAVYLNADEFAAKAQRGDARRADEAKSNAVFHEKHPEDQPVIDRITRNIRTIANSHRARRSWVTRKKMQAARERALKGEGK